MGALRTSIAGAVVGTVAAAGLYTGVVGPSVARTSATSADGTPLAASVPHAPKVVVTVKAHRAVPAPAPTTQDAVEANEDAQAPQPAAEPAPVVKPKKHRSTARATAEGRRAAASRERSSGTSSSGGSHHEDAGGSESEHEDVEAPEVEDHGDESDD